MNGPKKDTQEFIESAQEVHGNRYDYSLVDYQASRKKVKIICYLHGTFEQTPCNHLTGFGCLKCGHANAGQYHKKNTNSFIQEARSIHGDAYDYSKTSYIGARDKLIVTGTLGHQASSKGTIQRSLKVAGSHALTHLQ